MFLNFIDLADSAYNLFLNRPFVESFHALYGLIEQLLVWGVYCEG